jgi:hypothetical protein
MFSEKKIKNRLVSRRRGRDRMVVGLTTICAISTYHHYSVGYDGYELLFFRFFFLEGGYGYGV